MVAMSSFMVTTPSLNLLRMSSAKWAIPSRVVKPKKPAVPFIVWTVLKILFMSSMLSGSCSSSTNCWSRSSRFSFDSAKKSLRMSSSIPIGLYPPLFFQHTVFPKFTLFIEGSSPTGVSVAPRNR